MKAILIAAAAVLGLTAAAHADTYAGPPGMYGEPAETPAAQPANLEQAPPPAHRAQRARANGQLRADIIARFDRDGDGRLDPQERRRAVRALRRIARQLRQKEKRAKRAERRQNRDVDVDIDIRD